MLPLVQFLVAGQRMASPPFLLTGYVCSQPQHCWDTQVPTCHLGCVSADEVIQGLLKTELADRGQHTAQHKQQ